MEKDFKEKVLKRLSLIGMKKSHLATKIGISSVQLSQTFAGTRKLNTEEETKIRLFLNL